MSNDIPAGRELDELVALRVMGWSRGNAERGEMAWRVPDPAYKRGWRWVLEVPDFSTNLIYAMLPVAAWDGDITIRRQNGRWCVEMTQPSREWSAWAETLPLALCRAALKATGE